MILWKHLPMMCRNRSSQLNNFRNGKKWKKNSCKKWMKRWPLTPTASSAAAPRSHIRPIAATTRTALASAQNVRWKMTIWTRQIRASNGSIDATNITTETSWGKSSRIFRQKMKGQGELRETIRLQRLRQPCLECPLWRRRPILVQAASQVP